MKLKILVEPYFFSLQFYTHYYLGVLKNIFRYMTNMACPGKRTSAPGVMKLTILVEPSLIYIHFIW